MMDLSFRWPHPRFATEVGEMSFRVHSFDNAYGIDPAAFEKQELPGGGFRVTADHLVWAGGQRTAPGRMVVEVRVVDGEVEVSVDAELGEDIRSVGVTLHDQQTGAVAGVREGSLDIPATGRILRYPNGWFDLASPHFTVESSGRTLTVRSLDQLPRVKTFAFIPHFRSEETMDVDFLVEAEAHTPSRRFSAPAWRLSASVDRGVVEVRHREHVTNAYPGDAWENRDDVPEWLRKVSLVATLQGQHFTGRTFLNYAAMLDSLQRITERIDGERVLAYLPGWEGRYYRNYGRYGAEGTLGGADGFRRLVDGARELGVHVMPMYGANVASRDVPGFERWGQPALLKNASGLTSAGSVDWDGSRHYDHSGALLNPAHAPWRAHLVAQIAANHAEFGFDATFLDITAMHSNDPTGSTTEGLRALVAEIHEAVPGLLVAGEAWFDAIGNIIPLVQTGHNATIPVYHDLPDEELFSRTNRSFGHVSLGDPAFGSSGVHEAGYVHAWRLPVRRGVIPTLNVVDGTLDAARERVAQIIDDAREYADTFLS